MEINERWRRPEEAAHMKTNIKNNETAHGRQGHGVEFEVRNVSPERWPSARYRGCRRYPCSSSRVA